MGLLTFGINVTLDGCVDHQEGIADDETHAFFTRLMDEAGAMLWGRGPRPGNHPAGRTLSPTKKFPPRSRRTRRASGASGIRRCRCRARWPCRW